MSAWNPHCFIIGNTPLKINIDTKNNGLENVSPFKYGRFRVSVLVFRGVDLLSWICVMLGCGETPAPQRFQGNP